MLNDTKMRTLGKAFSCALLVFFAGAASAQDLRPEDTPDKCGAHSPQIKAVIQGASAKGLLTVELYKPSANAFLRKESRLDRVRIKSRGGAQVVCFNVPKPGSYALAAYQDVNANRKLDRKLNQLPSEPFALSNNQVLKLQFPKFEDAAFNVPATGAKVDMTLQMR